MIFGSLTKLFKPSQLALDANQLYCAAVAQARQPIFYTDLGVADTLDGRFDLIILHVFLMSRALASFKIEAADALNQAMMNRLFEDLDQSLREMGVGDVGVPKKMKKMAYAYNGRIQTYEAAWKDDTLADALARNVYRDSENPAAALTAYTQAVDAALQDHTLEQLVAGEIHWPQPPMANAA